MLRLIPWIQNIVQGNPCLLLTLQKIWKNWFSWNFQEKPLYIMKREGFKCLSFRIWLGALWLGINYEMSMRWQTCYCSIVRDINSELPRPATTHYMATIGMFAVDIDCGIGVVPMEVSQTNCSCFIFMWRQSPIIYDVNNWGKHISSHLDYHAHTWNLWDRYVFYLFYHSTYTYIVSLYSYIYIYI